MSLIMDLISVAVNMTTDTNEEVDLGLAAGRAGEADAPPRTVRTSDGRTSDGRTRSDEGVVENRGEEALAAPEARMRAGNLTEYMGR